MKKLLFLLIQFHLQATKDNICNNMTTSCRCPPAAEDLVLPNLSFPLGLWLMLSVSH